MRAEIISIGDELTNGSRLDTNSQWLSQQLGALGISIAFHTTIGDSLLDNIDAFRHAASRVDIVVSTGGLGPTADDLTRDAISAAFQRPLELREDALEHIEMLFKNRNRPMPERNRVQAMFPEGASVIPNPHGTAPGIDLNVVTNDRSCRIFALPGVPAEMKEMYSETVERLLVGELGAGKKRWYYKSLKVFGIGESDVEQLLPGLINRDRQPIVGITVSKATITLRIAACCESEQEFNEQIASTEKSIQETLGVLIFGTGDSELDDAVAAMLDEKQLRLGVIEFGSGVWIAPALSKHQSTDPNFGLVAAKWYPQVSGHLPMSPTTDQGQSFRKQEASNVGSSELELVRLAEEMIERESLDLCLAVSSYPSWENIHGTKELPLSEFDMILARRGRKTKVNRVTLGAHPDILYHRLAKTGLNLLRTELLEGE